MTLEEAIAEVRRVTPEDDPWTYEDFTEYAGGPLQVDEAIAAILNAVVSGELVTKDEARGQAPKEAKP